MIFFTNALRKMIDNLGRDKIEYGIRSCGKLLRFIHSERIAIQGVKPRRPIVGLQEQGFEASCNKLVHDTHRHTQSAIDRKHRAATKHYKFDASANYELRKLYDLAAEVDNQENTNIGDQEGPEQYIKRAETIISKAFDFVVILQGRLLGCLYTTRVDQAIPMKTAQASPEAIPVPESPVQPKAIELPPLPIPTFDGDIWEWDNFWKILDSNINSKDPEKVEYNYLLNAWKGRHERLLSSSETSAPFQQIQTIIVPSEDKGENINSSWFIRRLAKFPGSTNQKVINKNKD
ncbi:hypothetical protein COOONC_07065 [Cooperia oncophora]